MTNVTFSPRLCLSLAACDPRRSSRSDGFLESMALFEDSSAALRSLRRLQWTLVSRRLNGGRRVVTARCKGCPKFFNDLPEFATIPLALLIAHEHLQRLHSFIKSENARHFGSAHLDLTSKRLHVLADIGQNSLLHRQRTSTVTQPRYLELGQVTLSSPSRRDQALGLTVECAR
jgi:hypothetical protein